ncbi:MAG TPA: hypothetical protein VJW20_18860 [Candidatus Angelobacter sp.]|nr:hypothetical protein [Candidatus Angelobacter sp.]
MKAVYALVIAALSTIELLLLAALCISLFVTPGGSGEFTGLNQFGYSLMALMFVPPPAFAIVCILVFKFYRPENQQAFKSFAWGLGVALVMVPLVSILTSRVRSALPWHLIANAVVLAAWTAVIVWQRLTHSKAESLQTSA